MHLELAKLSAGSEDCLLMVKHAPILVIRIGNKITHIFEEKAAFFLVYTFYVNLEMMTICDFVMEEEKEELDKKLCFSLIIVN